MTRDPGTYILSSAVVFEDSGAHAGTVVAGWGGDNTQQHYRGGIAFLDAVSGRLLKRVYVVPDAEYAQGYAGGSVWDTGAVDPGSRSFFIGTGNPEAQGPQSPYTDALLKFDLDRRSPHFGELEATYEGTPETGPSVVGQVSQPVCSTVPQGVVPYPVNSVPCAHGDFDFGASPNLYRDRNGRLVIADLQKAGVFHAALAASMNPDWQQTVAAGCFACNASSGAFENGEIFSVNSLPGRLVALDGTTGAVAWIEPVTDALHYQSTSVADGVVYVYDGEVLHLFAAASGLPLAAEPLLTGVNSAGQSPADALGTSSSGIAIARHTVYVAGGEEIDALRLAQSSGPSGSKRPSTSRKPKHPATGSHRAPGFTG